MCQILAIIYYCELILYLLKSVAIHTAYTAVRENSSRSRNIPHSSITLLRGDNNVRTVRNATLHNNISGAQ